MRRVKVIAVGKLKEKYLVDAAAEYIKRLGRFCKLECVEVTDEKIPEDAAISQVETALKLESDRVLAKVRNGACLIVMDVDGVEMDSVSFAEELGKKIDAYPEIDFVIGGSMGLHATLRAAADMRVSMSQWTFPHQLARIILLEQLYRSFKIQNGETYHK